MIGEKFIDRYWVGTATRLSPEAPIPVVAVKEVIQSAGGAGNVYANLNALGARTLMYGPGHEPIKNRLMANGHQIARWDEEDHIEPIQFLKAEDFKDLDGLIISDYGKGAFTPESIKTLETLSRNVPYVFIDTKQSPEHFTHRYPNQTFHFPNMKEWSTHLTQYSNRSNVIRTESEKGMTHLRYAEAVWHTPALAKDVVSVCGAGDTAIAAFAYQYCKTQDIAGSMRFASRACAVVCGKQYTAVASHEEINQIAG